jgi:tetratricopeptide (TPR) repeat protein
MLLVYVVTLNAWVSLDSLRLVWSVSGLNWRRQLFSPVTFLVTYPFGWLPAAWIPLALNLFSATCAALSLVLLARSVALLPHDRTHAERIRQSHHRPYLTIWSAWLPPTLAVLVCGWQLTFWENAVAATGEMLDLLLFAYLVRSLLEFRLKHKRSWLLRFALVYGLAVANNWAMVAFGPAFLVAIIWMNLQAVNLAVLDEEWEELRSAGFPVGARLLRIIPLVIDLRLVARLAACWLAGFSLIFLLPLLASLAVAPHADFWASVWWTLVTCKHRLIGFSRYHVLMACLTSVIPVLFMGIRWRRSREDEDRLISKLAADNFPHLLHAFFLVVCLWTALDSPFSPRGLKLGYPSLPLYFLSSLSIGYFSGCFLLLFEKSRSHPLVGRFVTACIWLLAITAPGVVLCKNLPGILQDRNGPLAGYAAQIQRSLPAGGAVVLSDDPLRLMCLETANLGLGKNAAYLTIDTTLLPHGLPYLQFLERKHPGFKLSPSPTNQLSELAWPAALTDRLRDLAQEGTLYYLHPPFCPLLEVFRASPHGLAWQVRPCSTNGAGVPTLSPEQLQENRAFWRDANQKQLVGLAQRIQFPPPVRPAIVQRILRMAHVVQEPDHEAAGVGALYSVGLDAWGVELQKRGFWAEAAQCFNQAQGLNPDNPVARINRKANKDLQAHALPLIQSLPEVETGLGGARSWDQVVRTFGPVDEANCCFYQGMFLAEASSHRQAVEQFERVKALSPDYPGIHLRLAQALLKHRDFTNALAGALEVLRTEPKSPDALLVKGLALFETAQYREAIPPLTELLAMQSSNQAARLYRAQSRWKLNELEGARQDYEVVVQATPEAYPAYYALADIAYRNEDTPSAVRYSELFLGCAPPDLEETRAVKERLKELQQKQNRP